MVRALLQGMLVLLVLSVVAADAEELPGTHGEALGAESVALVLRGGSPTSLLNVPPSFADVASLGADLNELHDGATLPRQTHPSRALARYSPLTRAATAADVLLDVSAKVATVEEASLGDEDEMAKGKKAKDDHAELECERPSLFSLGPHFADLFTLCPL